MVITNGGKGICVWSIMMTNTQAEKHIWSSCVQILDGRDLLNERTDTENRYLKKASHSITPLYIIVCITCFLIARVCIGYVH